MEVVFPIVGGFVGDHVAYIDFSWRHEYFSGFAFFVLYHGCRCCCYGKRFGYGRVPMVEDM